MALLYLNENLAELLILCAVTILRFGTSVIYISPAAENPRLTYQI
jgi:hypothetical protein